MGEPWLTLLLSDYNILECMFWTLPPPTVARPGQRRVPWNTERRVWNEPTLTEFQSDLSQQLMGWRSGQVRFYCIIEQSARGASVRRHHHTSVWVHVIVWWLRVDTWHGLDTLGSAATAQTITGSLILIVAPHYSDCLLSQLSHTKAAFMPWIDFQLYMLYYFANRMH